MRTRLALVALLASSLAWAADPPAKKSGTDLTEPPTPTPLTPEEHKEAEVNAAIRSLASDDPDVRAQAANYFYTYPNPKAEPALRSLTNVQIEKEELVRRNALQALGELRQSAHYDLFMQVYDRDPSQIVKDWAIVGVGKCGNAKSFDRLRAWVEGKDTKKDDRLMAVVAMGFTKEKRAVDVLNGMLASDDKDLRENAYKALGNLGATDMCPVILQRIMGESSGQVMRAMIQTLSRLRCKEACATFEKMKATMNFREAEFRTLDEEIERAKAAIPCGSAPK